MKKKVILRRIFHRDQWRYAIIFDFNIKLGALVKSITGVTWSNTNKCWYANADESALKQILTVFRDHADIDISAIVSGEKKEDPLLQSPEKTSEKDESDTLVSLREILSFSVPEKKEPLKVQERQRFGPVQFTINESDGRLAVKFTGKYDPEWIEELKLYGRAYYVKIRNEWLLPWAQLTVDSLSDYFSSQGIEVIVKKNEVPEVLKELRSEMGNEVRERFPGKAALDGIEMVRRYLSEKRYSKNTLESYLSLLELFFKYYHDRDPKKITRKDVSGFFNDYVLKLGYSASYQNQMISAIKTYYGLCGMNRIDTDTLERPRRSRSLPKVFSKEEVMKIFSATRNSKHKLILWLVYSCGLRRSEVINIKITDLDTDRSILHIREGKGKVDRMVPIPQKVWEKIRIYINEYKPVSYLFEGQGGGKYSVESVYSVFKKSLRKAGIKKDVGVHCLRHSYATHLHESGLDIRYIQELLGHKSTRTTEIYTHVSRRDLFAIRSPIEDMDIE